MAGGDEAHEPHGDSGGVVQPHTYRPSADGTERARRGKRRAGGLHACQPAAAQATRESGLQRGPPRDGHAGDCGNPPLPGRTQELVRGGCRCRRYAAGRHELRPADKPFFNRMDRCWTPTPGTVSRSCCRSATLTLQRPGSDQLPSPRSPELRRPGPNGCGKRPSAPPVAMSPPPKSANVLPKSAKLPLSLLPIRSVRYMKFARPFTRAGE